MGLPDIISFVETVMLLFKDWQLKLMMFNDQKMYFLKLRCNIPIILGYLFFIKNKKNNIFESIYHSSYTISY